MFLAQKMWMLKGIPCTQSGEDLSQNCTNRRHKYWSFVRQSMASVVSVATSAGKINTETERKINEYREVRVGMAYSNCTVATVHIGNSVH